MNKRQQLIQGLAIVLLALLLGGGTPNLWAQQEQKEPIEPALPQEQEKQDAENTPAATPEETEAKGSPFEYESSEKISEDLSVSFPVDI